MKRIEIEVSHCNFCSYFESMGCYCKKTLPRRIINGNEYPIPDWCPLPDVEEPEDKSKISDGYHTFAELYEFRKMYNATLFNEWANADICNEDGSWGNKYDVHKSMRHNDGELCFGGGWFIVVAILPTGQITNHYKEKDWDLFRIPEVEKAKYPYDGHTPIDTLERLRLL